MNNFSARPDVPSGRNLASRLRRTNCIIFKNTKTPHHKITTKFKAQANTPHGWRVCSSVNIDGVK